MKHITFILYDSIFNSVFESQVIVPLQRRLDQAPGATATIISFESKSVSHRQIKKLCTDSRITIHVIKKIPFLGTLSLHYAAFKLTSFLRTFNATHIIARGPLAGWIAYNAIKTATPVIIQARGLAASEYLYAHSPASWWHQFRGWQYENIERKVYGQYAHTAAVTIHTVSDALQQYLIDTWHTPTEKVSVATYDVPKAYEPATVQTWRLHARAQLNIADDAFVYVYNGSAHPWQCPEKTISFFAEKYRINKNNFLLILTQSAAQFTTLLRAHHIPQSAFHITRVPHSDIYEYLAAADAGLLFREKHCINWVSRPTKALEYHAVGLPIIHNNTVAMLIKKRSPN